MSPALTESDDFAEWVFLESSQSQLSASIRRKEPYILSDTVSNCILSKKNNTCWATLLKVLYATRTENGRHLQQHGTVLLKYVYNRNYGWNRNGNPVSNNFCNWYKISIGLNRCHLIKPRWNSHINHQEASRLWIIKKESLLDVIAILLHVIVSSYAFERCSILLID